MFKSAVLSITLAALTLTAPTASAASSKIGVKLDGRTTTMSSSQMRRAHPDMFSAYRKAARVGKSFAANPDGPVPLGCVRFPFMFVCSHEGYWCAVSWHGDGLNFNCGHHTSSKPPTRALRLN